MPKAANLEQKKFLTRQILLDGVSNMTPDFEVTAALIFENEEAEQYYEARTNLNVLLDQSKSRLPMIIHACTYDPKDPDEPNLRTFHGLAIARTGPQASRPAVTNYDQRILFKSILDQKKE